MEIWDVYDKDGALTGRSTCRGEALAPGDFHLAVTVTVVNSKGELLLTQRSGKKTLCPGKWECPGGGVLAGETSRQGAVRELFEETGIRALPEELVYLARRQGPDWYMDDYGLRRDRDLEELTLQPEETDRAQWMPIPQWEQKARAGELFAIGYGEEYYAAVYSLAEAPADKPSPGELLDIYDQVGNLTGRSVRRGEPLAPGELCLVSAITIFDRQGRILCTLRSPEKIGAPNTWESPGGSVLAGETSRQGAIRELREETGIAVQEEELRFLHRRQIGDSIFMDVYALCWEGEPSALRLQKGETAGARWFSLTDWERLARERVILAGDYTDEFFSAVGRLAASAQIHTQEESKWQ